MRTVAAVTSRPAPIAAERTTRDAALNAVAGLLQQRNWSKISLSHVAAAAGISRQTLYNEFGNRSGVAQAYAIRLGERFAGLVSQSILANEGEVHHALYDGFRTFAEALAVEPLVQSLLSDEPNPDLLALVTTDSGAIREHARALLANTLHTGWPALDEQSANTVSKAIVRLGLTYVSMPPEDAGQSATEFADLFTPYFVAAVDRTDIG